VIREGKFLFAITGEGRSRLKYVLSKESEGRAKPGATVRVVPLDRRGPFGFPSAKVVAASKDALDFAEVSKAFFRQYGIPVGYPKRALAEAADAPEPVWENHGKRLDRRDEYIVTIDPADAKDHDDALSLEKLPDGHWKLGVHIADVSEYVPLDGPLDEEALRRSYTQYLPWTAAPMLPQRLSGDLCSLLEGRDRLAFSCFMEVAADGTLGKFEFVETFIRVSRFHSYQEAQGLKEQGEPFLNLLSEFTDSLLAKRKRDGHLDFQLPEPRVSLDENRAPRDIYPGVRLPSHGWVEECMLLANQACAMHLHRNKLPGVFRVHEQPDIEVVAELWAGQAELAGRMDAGAALQKLRETGGYLNPMVQQFYVRLLDPSRGALPPAVQRRILQSMKKAQYDARPMGHFALGWQYYAHFTSPIRRYADLWTHRMMKLHARGKKIPRALQTRAIAVAEEISGREIDVVKTERKAMRIATAWIFRKLVGREFAGEISGVENFGLFVTVTDPYGEGLVPVARIRGDYYEKDLATGHLVGVRTRRRFELGMRVRVRVAKSDPFSGHVDFDLLGTDQDGA
jgi:ribonuclease R